MARTCICKRIIFPLVALFTMSATPSLPQTIQEPTRLHFSGKGNTAVARGFVGGEATDSYVVHAKAGQKLTVRALSQLKRTQVYVSPMIGDGSPGEDLQRSDLTQWQGTVPQTGDYLVEVNVYPDAEQYTLRVTVE